MPDVICPKCRTLVPEWKSCYHCNFTLGEPAQKPIRSGCAAILTGLDPYLQNASANVLMQGVVKLPTSSTELNEVSVIAKVSDLAGFEALMEEGIKIGLILEPTEGFQHTLVTARIPVEKIDKIRKLPFVVCLKEAQRLRAFLDNTVADIRAGGNLNPAISSEVASDGGQGVVVGIVDFGLDFMHKNFRNADNSTRVLAIWDQSATASADTLSDSVCKFKYGKVYLKEDIDKVIEQNPADPYEALGYGPPTDAALGDQGTHGTHVTDIAAGNGRGSSLPGIAPNADIVFVEASTKALPSTSPDAVGDPFGDAAQLLEAVAFIFDTAGQKPCVVNISLGSNGGPHDGKTLVEEGFDRMLSGAENRAIVVASGNSSNTGTHISGKVKEGAFAEIIWEIPTIDATNNTLELWYSGGDVFSLELIQPDGTSSGDIEPNETVMLSISSDEDPIKMIVAHREGDSVNGDNHIAIFLNRSMKMGQWKLRLFGKSVEKGDFHAWIERDAEGQSRFVAPDDNAVTLSSIACGSQTIVVGSYDATDPEKESSFCSSAGPTRTGALKPEISAPGEFILAAHSRTQTRMTTKSGTSMAAAAVTGTVALMMAMAKENPLTVDEIRTILEKTAQKDPPGVDSLTDGWHPKYGFGRLDASSAVLEVMRRKPCPSRKAKRKGGSL